MKRNVELMAGLIVLIVLWKAPTYNTQWVFGPKYHMPVALVSDDGKHFADGTPLDFFTAGSIRRGMQEEEWLVAIGASAVPVAVLAMKTRRDMRHGKQSRAPVGPSAREIAGGQNYSLDQVLFSWDRVSHLSVRGLLTSVSTLGRTGSGKSSTSDKQLTRGVLAYPASGGLWLGSKPEDLDEFRRRLAEAGRLDDLLVFGPRHPHRFNLLEWILRSGGTPRDVAGFITQMGERLQASGKSGGGDDSAFFEQQVFRLFENAAGLIHLATGGITAPLLQRFIYTAASSPADLASETWREGPHNQILRAAAAAPKNPITQHDFELQRDFFVLEWPRLAEKTRSCILTSALGTLHVFNSGDVRVLASTDTTFTPRVMEDRKFVFCDASPSKYGDAGTFLSTALKLLTQRFILSRTFTPGEPIVVIHADEAHLFVNPFDATFLAQCRSHGGCMMYISQSLASYFSSFTGERGKEQAQALMANFGHHVFHALGSPDDAEYASSLLGNHREVSFGGSMQPAGDTFDALFGQSKFSGSFNEAWAPVLQPRVFTSLKCGGPENSYLADAIVVRSGEPFKTTGQNWIRATFSQR